MMLQRNVNESDEPCGENAVLLAQLTENQSQAENQKSLLMSQNEQRKEQIALIKQQDFQLQWGYQICCQKSSDFQSKINLNKN